MIKIILNIKINKNNKLKLKDKQSILYHIVNMYSDYGKLLHESKNNIKTGFSFYITKNEDKMYINISKERFKGLNLKYILEKNVGKELFIKEGLSIIYNDYKLSTVSDYVINNNDTLETLSPIYINEVKKINGNKPNYGVGNFQLEYNEDNMDDISKQILDNIKNYTGYNLTTDDVLIIPTFKTRLLTGFDEKHAWSCYYVKLMFKPNEENVNIINNVKKILLTNFFKSSYTGYFILK